MIRFSLIHKNVFSSFLKLKNIFSFLKGKRQTSGHVIVSNSNSQLVFSVPPHQCYKRFYFSTCLSRQQTNHGLCLCLHQYKKYVCSQNNKYKQVELLSMMFTLNNTTAQKNIVDVYYDDELSFVLVKLRENFLLCSFLFRGKIFSTSHATQTTDFHILIVSLVSTAFNMMFSFRCVRFGSEKLSVVGKIRSLKFVNV